MTKYKSFAKEYYIGVKENTEKFYKAKITCSKDVYEYIQQFYYDDIHVYESFFVLFCNMANNTIGWVKLSQGGISGTLADTRLIAKLAIESLCVRVFLAHNHPSDNKIPSEADINLTKKIKEALKLFDIEVVDHIILTPENGYYSFADEGMI